MSAKLIEYADASPRVRAVYDDRPVLENLVLHRGDEVAPKSPAEKQRRGAQIVQLRSTRSNKRSGKRESRLAQPTMPATVWHTRWRWTIFVLVATSSVTP